MSETSTKLTIGVVPSGDPKTAVACELLDHQGVIYETISRGNSSSQRYPVVILPEYSDSAFSVARENCVSEGNVIIAEKTINLPKIRQFLSGEVSIRRDQFDLFVNKEEVELVSKIGDLLAGLNLPFVRKSFWPRRAKACCVVTHDIDWFTYSPFHKAVLDGKLKTTQLIRLFISNLFRRKNYGWNIPEMLDLESGSGCRSTYLFKTEYLESELVLLDRSIELLKQRQRFEIALHASHSSHKDASALESELASFRNKVGRDPVGIRYHILKFNPPQTWKLEVDKNMLYDATFSYNEFFGFRSEVCFPYRPFAGLERLPLVELPTGFMDWTLLHRKKRGQSAESMLQQVKESVERYNGLLVVNFHNTYINRETFPDIFALYTSLLKQVAGENYWVATASECAKWWTERASARPDPKLTPDGTITASHTPVELEVIAQKEFSVKYL